MPSSAPKGHELGRAFPRGIPGHKGTHLGLGPSPTLRRTPNSRLRVPAPPFMPAVFLLFCPVPAERAGQVSAGHYVVVIEKGSSALKGRTSLRKRNGRRVSASLCQPEIFSGAVAPSAHEREIIF